MNLPEDIQKQLSGFIKSHQETGDKSSIILLTSQRGLHGHKFEQDGVQVSWKFVKQIPVHPDGTSLVYITTKRYWKQLRKQTQLYAAKLRGRVY